MIFHGHFGSPQILRPAWLRLNVSVPGPHSNSQTVGVAIQHAKYIMKHAGIKGYEKTRMQITKIRKIKAVKCYNRGSRTQARGNASQPGGPSTEGPADFRELFGVSWFSQSYK